MSGDRISLDEVSLAVLKWTSEERNRSIIEGMLQAPDYPPLPACPECGEHPELIESRVGHVAFDEADGAVLLNFSPCGHRFRAAVSL